MNQKFSIENSQKIYKRAQGIIPGGSQTFSKGPNSIRRWFYAQVH
jgi:hypothetical protein